MALTVEDALGSANILEYWLASDASGVGDGNSVENWTGKVKSIVLTQGTESKRPIYRANYAATGQAALEFDGADDFMSVTDASFGVTGFFLIAAVKTNVAANADTILMLSNGAGKWHRWRVGANSTTFDAQAEGSAQTATVITAATIPVLSAWFHPTAFVLAQSDEASGAITADQTLTACTTCYVGARDGTMQFLDGGLFAAIVVDDAAGWYNAIRAAVVLRNDLGQTLYDTLPAESGGNVIVIED